MWFASLLLLVCLNLATPVFADDPPQPPANCTLTGCGKPGTAMLPGR